jgi:hypothetical protein
MRRPLSDDLLISTRHGDRRDAPPQPDRVRYGRREINNAAPHERPRSLTVTTTERPLRSRGSAGVAAPTQRAGSPHQLQIMYGLSGEQWHEVRPALSLVN